MGKKVLCFAIVLLAMCTAAQAAYQCTKIQPVAGEWIVTYDNGSTAIWNVEEKDFIVAGLTCAQAVIGEGYKNPDTDNISFIFVWASFLQNPTKHEYQYLETPHPAVYDMNWLNSHAAGFTALIAADNSTGFFDNFTKTGKGPAQFATGKRKCTDDDGDGYFVEKGCSTLVQDCNDNDSEENVKCQCADLDRDGYFVGDNCTKSKKDCNDNDATIFDNKTGYPDADGDGFTLADNVTLCTGASLPAGYLATKSATVDCDDTSATYNVVCPTCDITFIPSKFSKLRAIISPIEPFVITADSASDVVFTRPLDIKFSSVAINDIFKITLGKKMIFGLLLVRALKLESAGEYDVSVTFGDTDTMCGGTITVK